ncbi:conserved protein of unknown function [Tenacibaculum soleae]|nr:putative zinc-binding metallopeptidase [Tenacibaculum soleae]
MKNIKYLVIALAITFSNCQEKDIPNPDKSSINSELGYQNQFDKFLTKEFVTPYNIEILYKLPDVESNFNYTLVPADYQKSIRLANLIKYLCLDAYNAVAPASFLKETFPKQIVFVGSAGYNNNNTRLLGTAEGGVKISLYDINTLDITDVEALNRLFFNTIHHEFGHVLHQKIPFSTDFTEIVGAGYIGDDWSTQWGPGESLQAGFISDYASNQVSDDFVELISHYVLSTETDWADIIVNAGPGGSLITSKMSIIKSYLKNNWDFDIDDLRAEVQDRYDNLSSQDLDNIN